MEVFFFFSTWKLHKAPVQTLQEVMGVAPQTSSPLSFLDEKSPGEEKLLDPGTHLQSL